MVYKKNIITSIILTSLVLCCGAVFASSSSDLIKMDVKRSAAADTVDVTFYTTSGGGNTVVTRKDNNRYVVLLPNTSASASVAPNISALKDLVSDVNVKHVDDGIGGYTKVTFSTTKPLKIQTFNQKTAPLTKAQQEYKNLIAQNNKTSVPKNIENVQKTPVKNNTPAKPSAQPTQAKAAPAAKPANNVKAPSNQPKTAAPTVKVTQKKSAVAESAKNTAKVVNNVNNKPQQVSSTPKKVVKETSPKPVEISQNNTDIPKTISKRQKKPVGDLTPEVSHKIERGYVVPRINPAAKTDNNSVNLEQPKQDLSTPNAATQNSLTKNSGKNPLQNKWNIQPLPFICLAGIMLFIGFVNFVAKLFSKHSEALRDLLEVKEVSPQPENKREFDEIMYDNRMSWQEKFKHYNENNTVEDVASSDYTFVTNTSADKSAVIDNNPEKSNNNKEVVRDRAFVVGQRQNKQNILKKITKLDKNSPKNILSVDDPEAHGRLQSKIEHAFKNSVPQYNDNEVKSEDDVITNSMSHVKLRSFAKHKNLLQSNRGVLKEDKKVSQPSRETRFVKLRNSALSMNNRSVLANNYGFSITDLIKTGNKYLNNSGENGMEEMNGNYSQASLKEYFSILDNETSGSEMSGMQLPIREKSVGRATNPISAARKSAEVKSSELDGLVVQSGYNIDEEKGFYLANMGGMTALVGKIKENIFVLKRFDRIVNEQLQVRLDYGSVYIVKAGGFKCLVDVSEDKMGTLLEI